MPEKLVGLYSIDQFSTELGYDAGHYGPRIVLAGRVAHGIMRNAPKRTGDEPINEMIKNRIRRSFSRGERWPHNITYVRDTWLLRTFSVPGDCACIGIDGSAYQELEDYSLEDIERAGGHGHLVYAPHNIDTPQQAAAIVSTWLLWFNLAVTFSGYDLPFAM